MGQCIQKRAVGGDDAQIGPRYGGEERYGIGHTWMVGKYQHWPLAWHMLHADDSKLGVEGPQCPCTTRAQACFADNLIITDNLVSKLARRPPTKRVQQTTPALD